MKTFATAIAALFALAGMTTAGTLNFDTAVNCVSPDSEVTLSLHTGSTCGPWANPGSGTPGLGIHGSGVELLRADFTVGVSLVSVDLGDLGGADSDLLSLQVFSATDALLGSTTYLLPAYTAEMHTLTLTSATNIAYAIFGTTADNGFIAVDNLTWRTVDVPLPASALFLATGFAFMVAGRRRKSRN